MGGSITKVSEKALTENTKAETAFMQSTTNAMEFQNLLDHLEQYPQQGRGRGVGPCQVTRRLKSPGSNSKENDLNDSPNSEILDGELMNDTPTNDSNSSTISKPKASTSIIEKLRRLNTKTPTENVIQSSDLDTSTDSESKLNLSNYSERSDGSSTPKGIVTKLRELKEKKNSEETMNNSFSSAKSTPSESEEQKKSTKKSTFRLLQELKAKSRKGGEQNFTESSTENSSLKSEETETSDASYISESSNKKTFFCSDRRKCEYDKYVCKCENCVGWVSTQIYHSHKQGFVDKHNTKPKVVFKPPLLLKSSDEQMDEKFMKSYATIVASKSKIEIASLPKILVHGRCIPLPVSSINSVAFHPNIQAHMRKYETIYSIQNYVWPALMRTLNVCMVNPAQSGKTVAYMPAVLSYLLESDTRYTNLPKNSSGPIVIILCPKTEIAEKVFQLTSQFLSGVRRKPVCALAVPPMDKDCVNQFQKRCDLLVTTPPMLVSLLNSRDIEILRVCHLVLESCDKILDIYFDDLNVILNIIQCMLNKRVCNNSVQLITTAECWTPSLENLIKRIQLIPNIYIGSFLEAALYGRANLQLSFVSSTQKVISLIEILDKSWKTSRSLVLFNENSEIDEVKEHLQVQGITALCIYDNTEKYDVGEMETRWSETVAGNHMVLLCTDLVFNNTLNISSAFVLVHYSLPNRWTQFVKRFSCLIDSYDSPLTVKKVGAQIRSQVYVFSDEDCDEQFSRLLRLLVRMGAKISDEFHEFYKKLINKSEQDNLESNVQLCPNVKLFGECPSRICDTRALTYQEATLSFNARCEKRHVLSKKLEKLDKLPNCGIIKYKILHMKNVSCVTVKLLEWTDSTGKKHAMENFDDLGTKLKETLQDQKITIGNANVDDSYVHVSNRDGTCLRCVVLQVIKVESITKRASVVLVRFLDTGRESQVETVDLYHLPSEFKLIPSQSVDLYIANMIPPHLDDSWSDRCLTKVAKLLERADYKDEGVYGNSRIYLRLGDVFWVDNVMLKENLTTTNATVVRLNMKKALLDANLASCSENQLTNLYQLCEEAGIVLPDYSLPLVAKPVAIASVQQATPQWMHLDPDDDRMAIYIVCNHTPDLFYVRLQKYDDLFESLQKDIQKAITKPLYKSEFNVEVNKFYLAKDPDGEDFCRVKVIDIDGDKARCFYVDFGDFSNVNISTLKFLPDYLITKLPFQVIECRLHGIAPALDEWEENAITIMDHYTFEPNTDIFRTLYCNICATETSTNTGEKKYSVILVDCLKKQVVVVNQQFINCGAAVPLEGENLDVNFEVARENPDNQEEYDDQQEENDNQQEETHADSSFDEEEPYFDFQIIKPELFISEITKVQIPQRPRAIAPAAVPRLPQMTAVPPCDHSTPKVVWYQNNTHIKLGIELIGVENFDLHVLRQKFLSFKTVCNGTNYKLNLPLYDKVGKTIATSNCGLQIRLVIEKCVPYNWPRLLHSTQKMNNIKYDLSKCDIDEDEDVEDQVFLNCGSDFSDDLSDNSIILDYTSGSSGSEEMKFSSDDESLNS